MRVLLFTSCCVICARHIFTNKQAYAYDTGKVNNVFTYIFLK